ncbi:MAG: bifunctional (p)ppGpp synthetase/guanosine-3',5'-bis(diphosphate) 3'-pyrophosphohydrolase [Polyangiaceae bacterium]|nr:bifunctional (p)ppGpp synthetase/guanosine-3',5'-bis(diphosphate) 3'-pyrophosphohydrolase [Polyangiaceae bacterium]
MTGTHDRAWGARFEEALTFAAARHAGQVRKGNGAPYITHPLAVASIVGEFGGDEEQAVAALLHDVMEDCQVSAEEIAATFGAGVAEIVEHCTDTTEHPKPPWRPRKEAHLAKLATLPARAKLVIAADKLHNALATVRDLDRPSVGPVVWSRFRAGRDEVLWYYRAAHAALATDWDHEIVRELGRAVAELEKR